MRSHLLEGMVRHRRSRPFVYELEHDVYYVALDLDELDEVGRVAPAAQPQPPQRPELPRRRPLARRPTDLPATVRDHLRAEGVDPDGWRITLVTNLRVFGYVFNPASFYLCRDGDGDAAGRRRRGP